MSKKPQKKTRKDYDYYTMNIPNELRILFEAYIGKFPNLGFKNVSQYILHILQMKAEEIIQKNLDLNKIEEITLSSGSKIKLRLLRVQDVINIIDFNKNSVGSSWLYRYAASIVKVIVSTDNGNTWRIFKEGINSSLMRNYRCIRWLRR